MKQPIRGKKSVKNKKIHKKSQKGVKFQSQKSQKGVKYGISKLESDFASEVLDKLKLKYIYQFEATNIKRFYDFAVTVYDKYDFKYELKEGIKSIIQEGKERFIGFLIEIDGDYYHSNPKTVDKDKLNPMQKHNKFVDKIKDEWALMNGIPLLRIWEDDIRNNLKEVIKIVEKYVNEAKKRAYLIENKRKPH